MAVKKGIYCRAAWDFVDQTNKLIIEVQMKKILLVLICVAFFLNGKAAAADIGVLTGFHIGVKAGLTYPARMIRGAIPLVNYCAGVSAEYFFLDDIFSASTGLIYINETQKYEHHDRYNTVETGYTHYFSFPLCAKGFITLGDFRPHLIAGIAYDTTPSVDVNWHSDNQNSTFPMEKNYSSASYILGAGCYYMMGTDNMITLEAVYKKELEQYSKTGQKFMGNADIAVMCVNAGYNF